MKIINKTQWDTRALRKVFTAVYRESVKYDGKHDWRLKITVVYARGWGGYSGCAYLNSGTMRIRLPKPGNLRGETLDIFNLAHLFEHELAHCRGQNHDTMGKLNNWKFAVAEEYPYLDPQTHAVPLKAEKPKIRRDVQVDRHDRVAARRPA